MRPNLAFLHERLRMEARLQPLREQGMKELSTPRSIFADDRPTDIGTIRLVDTFLWRRSDWKSPSWRMQSVVVAFVIVFFSLGLMTLLNPDMKPPLVAMLTCVAIFLLSLPMLLAQRCYSDFFVGDRGCCVVNFLGKRSKVKSRHVFRYSDYNVFLMGETLHNEPVGGWGENQMPEGSDYYHHTFFTVGFFNIRFFREGELQVSAGFDQGTHCRQYLGGPVPEPQFRFWSTVEEVWTSRQLERLSDDLENMPRQTFYEFVLTGTSVPRTFMAHPLVHLTLDGLQLKDGGYIPWGDVSEAVHLMDIGRHQLLVTTVDGTCHALDVGRLGNLRLLLSLIQVFTGREVAVSYGDAEPRHSNEHA